MPRRRLKYSYEQLQFGRGRFIGLREARWTYRRIAAHVGHNVYVVCRCFQQWSVEHSHTCRPGSGRPRSTDARQSRRIVRAPVAASREEIWTHVAPAVSPRIIWNRLLEEGPRSRVPLATTLPRNSRLESGMALCCLQYASDGLTSVMGGSPSDVSEEPVT